QAEQPLDEEARSRAFVGVAPESLQLLLEIVGLEEPAVESQSLLELTLLGAGEIVPAGQQQPTLAPHQSPQGTLLAEELLSAGLVHGGVDVLHYVELVEDDGRSRQVFPQALQVWFPHVHADRTYPSPAPRRQVLSEEAVQGLTLALRTRPEGFPSLQVRDHREALALTPEDLIDSHVSQRSTWAAVTPGRKSSLIDAEHGLHGQTPLRGDAPHRCVLAVPSYRFGKAPRVRPF